jgi:hypothetical protein
MVDYSKWKNIEVSDDEDGEETVGGAAIMA